MSNKRRIYTKLWNGLQGFSQSFQFGTGYRQSGGSYAVVNANSLDSIQVGPKAAYTLYEQVSVVSDAVNKIVEPGSTLPLAMENNNDGDFMTDTSKSELLTLLTAPQANISGTQLILEALKSFLLTEEVWLVLAGSGRPVSIDYVKPYNVDDSRINIKDRFPEKIRLYGERYRDKVFIKDVMDNGLIRYLADEGITELIPIIGNTNTTDFRGMSKLNAAVLEAKQVQLGATHNSQLLVNGARPSGIIVPQEGLEKDQFDQFESSLREQFQGAANAGNVVIASIPVEKMDFSMNNRDMDYINLIKLSRAAVYVAYNIPLAMTTSDKQTFSNVAESTPQLYVNAILPMFHRFAKLASFHLQHRFPELENSTLSVDPFKVPQIQSLLLDKMKTMAEVQVFEDNEIRKTGGFDPYDGGDEVYKPANMVPVGENLGFGAE
ncbi:phage portal protein [Candidatus Pacearchaeota archaeon]|nr:phage portal protein [Candidatus Pacearchaeota archaeon]